MPGRYVSLFLALAALAGAVLYAQKKGSENPRPDPVFDSSKAIAPMPVDADEKSREHDRPKSEDRAKKNAREQQQSNQPEDKWPEPKEYPRKKKGQRVMPSSKSYVPE